METVWFILVAFTVIAYVVLDGFDLGAGMINMFIAKNPQEHQMILRAIGPVWDGNEVWLIAAAGALFFAFPLLYASSFSGFYLPLMIVLWLLMLRGISIELRSHVHDPLWWTFFDFVFSMSSLLLTVFFGVALGNVMRGVPLQPDYYFFAALWTDFRVSASPGILDWYTLLIGALALATLGVHGAQYIAVKTTGNLYTRACRVAVLGWRALWVFTIFSALATVYVRPQVTHNFRVYWWGWGIPVVVVGALFAMPISRARGWDKTAFLASATYIIGMLAGAAFMMYPYLLPASTDSAYSLTIYNAKAGAYSLQVGLIWWLLGITLAVGYFAFLYRSFRGKVTSQDGEGH